MLVSREPWDSRDPKVLKGQMDRLDRQAPLVRQVSPVVLDQMGYLDQVAHKEVLDPMVSLVLMVNLGLQDQMEVLEILGHRD